MDVTERDLAKAVDAGIMDAAASARLWQFLSTGASPSRAKFDVTNLFWYAGALIVIGATGLFSSEAFGRWGPGALLLTALIYAVAFGLAGAFFWRSSAHRVLGGLLITVAVSMAPLGAFGLQQLLGWSVAPGDPNGAYRDFYVWIRASWVPMDLAAIVAGAVAFYFCRFSLITAVIAVAIWFLSMDVAQLIMVQLSAASPDYQSYDLQQLVRGYISLALGTLLLVVAWWLDLRNARSLTFWLHFNAALCLVTGMGFILLRSGVSEPQWAIFSALCIVMLLFAVYIRRRPYLVFGALGIVSYLGHLASTVFRDSVEFTFALTAVGIGVIIIGYLWMRAQADFSRWMETSMPPSLQRLRPL